MAILAPKKAAASSASFSTKTKTMPQFYLAPEATDGKTFRLSGPEAFHLVKVMRCREGESLALFDGRGGRFEGVIERIHPDGTVTGTLMALRVEASRRQVRVHLYSGLLKAAPWDYLLEKGTELGVASFTPILTPRTVVVLHEAGRIQAKQERWKRVLMASAKQCGIDRIPELRELAQFRDAIKACEGKGLVLLAWEGMSSATAHESLRPKLREVDAASKGPIDAHIFIGPTGGFTEDEVELARSLGAHPFGMGTRIMRAETAALAACALVQYELGTL